MGSKGISPLIASVFVILFGVTILAISLGVINPTFRRAKDTAIVNDAFHTLETLNTAIKEVASEPDGSRRVVPITVSEGTLRVSTTYDWLYFDYEPMETMDISGTKGDIRIVRGLEFADWFNYYADGSIATPTWTNTSGQATISSGAYSITNGTSYHNVSGPLENWKFSATISNVTGSTGGQVFALPVNPESLVLYLPMDEAAGSDTAYDYSGSINNGTLTSMATGGGDALSGWQSSADCKAGTSCLVFDGGNDYVNSRNSSSLNPTSAITISCWFKLNTLPGGASGTVRTCVSRGSEGLNHLYWLGVWNLSNTYYAFWEFGNGTHRTYTSGVDATFIPVIDQWYHLASTYDSSTGAGKVYLDGALKKAVYPNFTQLGTNTYNTLIGRYSASAGHYMNGTIDEVMIFNRSLTDGEIKALYETSTKKLLATGTQTVTTKTNVSIVLANPVGQTKFDDVTVTRDRNELKMVIPYSNVDLNGTLRLSKGEHKVQIRHMATNATTDRPIVELTAA